MTRSPSARAGTALGLHTSARLLLALLGSLSGCHSCSSEKPYTPFGVTSALPAVSSLTSAAPLASSSAHELDAGVSSVRKALLAPSAAKQWNLSGRALDAPTGRVFEQAIVADFDQDQQTDVAAWTLPEPSAPPESSPGELWLFPGNGDARRVLEFPAFLPTGANCTSVTALSASTPSTVTADVRVACTTQLVGRAPTRALAVIEPFNATPLRFGVRAAEAAPDEILSLELLPEDEDNDGRSDFGLRVGVGQPERSAAPANESGSSGAPAELFALFQFLDRAAGVSRDASQPHKSLLEALKKDMARALKKKTADVALAHVEQTRRLLASACAEGATARVFDWSGAPLSCAPLGDVVDRLGAIEISAELALNHFAGALGALTRDGWYFGAMHKATRSQAEKDIDKRVTSRGVSKVELTTRARSAPSPGRAPIAFSADGSLLIEAPNGLFQVHPNELRPELIADGDAGGAAWPNDASLSSGERWLAATYSCDRSEVSLLLAGAGDAVRKLPLLAPRPGVCGGARFEPHFAPQVAGLEPSFEVLVGGALLRTASAPHSFPAGVARSADGKSLVIPTPLGLLVGSGRSPAATEAEDVSLWKIEGFAEHTPDACVVANGAERAACVRNGRVELYLKTDSSTLGVKQ